MSTTGSIPFALPKVYLRVEIAERTFRKVPFNLRIREGKKPLWVQHPSADVAMTRIALPPFFVKQSRRNPLLSTDLLADDTFIQRFEMHPGDELLCLGYPLGAEANPQGFPILRSGRTDDVLPKFSLLSCYWLKAQNAEGLGGSVPKVRACR